MGKIPGRKALTSIQRLTRQPKITKISRTHFPGECSRAEQGLGQVRGRDGPEGGRPASPRPADLSQPCVKPTQLSTVSRRRSEPLFQGWWPRGGTPRPAGLGEAGRPHWEASWTGSWRESKAQPSHLLSTDATCNTSREPTLEDYK